MSSSKVISRFALTDEAHPVGSEEFVVQFYRERDEQSPAVQKLRQLAQQQEVAAKQVFQNGYAEGQAAGLQQGLAEARRVEAQLAATISALVSHRETVYQQAKTQLLELAFAIADKITASRAVVESDTVMETINRCIAEILDKTHLRIRVHPEQCEFVKSKVDELSQSHDAIAVTTVEPDSRVSVGGCVIETDSGCADARIESQLRMLRDKLIALEP